jgi:ABC-type glycerol-3-phosphate transport system permease component
MRPTERATLVEAPAHPARAATARRRRRLLRQALLHLVLAGGSLLFALPLLWMVRTSLLPPELILAEPPVWLPWPPRWENYAEMWSAGPFLAWLRNTVIVTAVGVVGLTVSSTLAAFGFARTRFPGRDGLFLLVLATLMIPFHVRLVPEFMLFNWLGWVNTLLPLTVPALFGSPFYIFILRQFFLTIPRELDEAAEIDGASLWTILWRINVPLATPAIASVAAFAFISEWNDFVRPLLFLHTPDTLTLAVGVRWFTGRYATQFHLLMAASVVVLLPMIIVFFLCQKQFLRGIALTGLKG